MSIFKVSKTSGSGCGSIGRAVASDMNGWHFKSNHQQNLYCRFVSCPLCCKGRELKQTAHWPSPPAFVDCSSNVASSSSCYEALFGATCWASVLICPWILRQQQARQLWPMSSLFILDVYASTLQLFVFQQRSHLLPKIQKFSKFSLKVTEPFYAII